MKKVALICVTRNNFEKLKVTIESILKHTKDVSYDLYIIDNASTDDTIGLYGLVLPENIVLVKNNKNLNWVKGINQGLDLTKNYQYVCFLNNDIEVSQNWLSNMIKVLDDNTHIGAIGPLTSNSRDWQGYDRVRKHFEYPWIKECPLERSNVNEMAKFVQRFPKDSFLVSGMLAFFCTLIRRKVIDEIGYLDEQFNEIYLGDDDDFCRRLEAAGYYLAVSTHSYVAHYSGTSSLNVPEYEARQKKARDILAKKFSHK